MYSNTLTCTVTKKNGFVKGELDCNTSNITYLIFYKLCSKQYVGSATNFKNRLRIHKSDIPTKEDCCGTAQYFNNKCCDQHDPHKYLSK